MKTILQLLGLVCLLAQASFAQYANGYSNRYLVTINSGQVSGTQTDYPQILCGTYSYLKTVANGGTVISTVSHNSQTVPADLVFSSDANGASTLAHEIHQYTPTTGKICGAVKWSSIADGGS